MNGKKILFFSLLLVAIRLFCQLVFPTIDDSQLCLLALHYISAINDASFGMDSAICYVHVP